MTVIETDGHYVEPFDVKNLYIYSGETYSVLVTTNQTSRNYWITTNVVSREPETPMGLAIFNYFPNPPGLNPPTDPPTGPLWNDTSSRRAQSSAIKARNGSIETPPETSNQTLLLLNTQNEINGYRKWAINNVSLTFPTTPYLIALKLGNKLPQPVFDPTSPPKTYDWENYDIHATPTNINTTSSNGIHRLDFNAIVDVVLQNANMIKPGTSETHPWHLHGHDFWVLGYGEGKFNPEKDPKLQLERPDNEEYGSSSSIWVDCYTVSG